MSGPAQTAGSATLPPAQQAGGPAARVPGLDEAQLARLQHWLHERYGASRRPLAIERARSGMSNPTFFLRWGDRLDAVLRKQPPGELAPSAHAIDREWRVLQALRGSAVPVPEPIAWCGEREVLGTPFYLMQRLEGRIFLQYAAPGLAREERAAVYDAMAAAMAAIHRVDVAAAGLADYGRAGNYFERQLARWSAMWRQWRRGDADNPALDAVTAWLAGHVPASTTTTLVHGDLRIGNLVFHPREPRVIGVLDWELSTLGHPLVDVAYSVQAWRMAADENGGLAGAPLAQLGIPAEDAYLERYYALAGSAERLSDFHRVFAMFRAAVGSASVARRGEGGNSVLPDSARIGRKLALAYAGQALAIIEKTA